MIKLILADMDGTLLPFGSRVVSERTHSAILSALDAGIAFGPASGRDYADLADAFDGDARCFSTGIMANGKKVFSSGELVFKKTLSTEALVKLDSAVRPYAGTSLWLVADVDASAASSSSAPSSLATNSPWKSLRTPEETWRSETCPRTVTS